MKSLSLYQQHVQKWTGCQSCPLHEHRKSMVFARGQIPASVLFLGEAPGASEDVLGYPFVGPAGMLLDKIIEHALTAITLEAGFGIAFTNLVCCIPIHEGDKGEPDHEEVMACKPRLEEFIKLARPRLIVCVGKLSEQYLEQGLKYSVKLPQGVKTIGIAHPASILRAKEVQKGSMIMRCVVTLRNAVEDL